MSRNNKILIFIIIIVLSLLGGVLGGILVRSYFINSSFDIPLFGDINLGSNYQGGSFIISQPRKVIVEQNDRVRGIVTEARKSMVAFYAKKSSSAAKEKKFNINNYYLPKDKVGEGLVLTNDGWIITTTKIDNPANFTAIDYEGNIIEIEKTFFDKDSNYYFIKIKARNLIAVQFAEKGSVTSGQLLVAVRSDNTKIVYIENANYYPDNLLVKSSERLYRFIKIDNTSLDRGDIQFNLDGSVVGLYSEKGLITPINYFTNLLPGLLNDQQIIRPVLGVRYIILDDLVGEEEIEGALIAKDINGVAIVWKSPAAEAELQEGDIILEVDGIKVDADNSLSELIHSYEPEKEIELTILREEEEMRVKVKLSSEQ